MPMNSVIKVRIRLAILPNTVLTGGFRLTGLREGHWSFLTFALSAWFTPPLPVGVSGQWDCSAQYLKVPGVMR